MLPVKPPVQGEGWRRGPIHERGELPAIEPAPLQRRGKVAANGGISEGTICRLREQSDARANQ